MNTRLAALLLTVTMAALPVEGEAAEPPVNTTSPNFILHEFARICPQSEIYDVKVNGRDAFVYDATRASFVSLESNEPVEVEIRVAKAFKRLRILPLRLGIEPETDGQVIRFTLPSAERAYIETDLNEHLFIFGNRIVTEKPDPNAPGVHYFEGGQVYEVDELVLEAGNTLYVDAGAVIRGQVRATRANDVTLAGLGVIDGSYYAGERKVQPRTVLIEDSRNTTIRDLTIIESQVWVITLYYCEDVVVDNVKEISHGYSTDGVDVVSCERVLIENSLFRNDDDCVVIKAFRDRYKTYSPIEQNTHLKGVHHVLVRGCELQTNLGGHVFEIGHELMADSISNICFEDCDVLGAHDHGGVFGLHNADAARVSDIVFEDIRVDHYYNKLIDMRILKSRYSRAEETGTAENILFKDIDITVSEVNVGYSLSFIAGWDEDHPIKNVTFDNFRMNGEKITHADQLDLFTKYTENIVFK